MVFLGITCFERWTLTICMLAWGIADVIAQLYYLQICYARTNATNIYTGANRTVWNRTASLVVLVSIDNLSLRYFLCQHVFYTLDTNYETFTLTVLKNILLVQGISLVDLSLIIGNLIDTLLSGFLVVFTLYI